MSSKHTGGTRDRMSRGDDRVVAFTRWVVRWRWLVIVLSVFAALAAAMGGQYLGFSTNYRVFFSSENPQLNAFESIQKIYSRDDNIFFVVKPNEGEVFTPELLSGLRALADESWQIPFATRVDGLSNFQNSYASGEDDLTVEDLVPSGSSLDRADIDRIRSTSLTEPLLRDRLISPDGTTAGVSVTISLPRESEEEVPLAMAKAREIADAFRAAHPQVTIGITGSIALNNAFSEASLDDMALLYPLMFAILLLVTGLLLRSAYGTIATLIVILFSSMTAMGLAGYLGILLTPPSAVAPTIILTIAIADSIHILVTMLHRMRLGDDRKTALIESMRVNFQPVFLTSLTTCIGFVSLNFSDAPPFRDLGNITAIGVAAAWIYSIFFLPALVSLLPIKVRARAEAENSLAERIGAFVIARHRAVLPATLVVVIGLSVLIPRLELNDQFVEYFDHSVSFRTDTDFATENLSGIYQAQWSIPAAGPGGISEPAYLALLDSFAEWLRANPHIVHVQTLSDTFKRLNKNMHGDTQEWYRLPEERDLAAQYLLLFELSLPYGLDLNNQINIDKSSVRVVATLQNITTNELRALDDAAAHWLSEHHVVGDDIRATGPFVMFAYIAERNIQSMLIGTVLAFVLISLTLAIALRSVRLGLISLVPNLVPAAMAFGIWSILVGQVGLASSVIAATSLGIIVDATVHFLSKYQRARVQKGYTAEEGVRYAFSTVGTALWVTSAILIAGFAILSLSAFEINAVLGQLTAITLALALAIDFLLLPSILLALDGRVDSGMASSGAATPLSEQAAE